MRRTRNQKGFTIMELMIVIVIIGILIAIAVPAYKAFRDRAAAAACQSNLRTLKSAVGLYYADTGLVATDIARDLNPYMDNADTIHCPSKVAAGAYYTYSLDAAGVPVCDSEIAGHALP